MNHLIDRLQGWRFENDLNMNC